jgi:hypothetical protein
VLCILRRSLAASSYSTMHALCTLGRDWKPVQDAATVFITTAKAPGETATFHVPAKVGVVREDSLFIRSIDEVARCNWWDT